ncbi:MAG: hypothetical protein KA712_07525 [Myxococcales bacterium]|nr:hypothetical protein [Myxococcales bacterium]
MALASLIAAALVFLTQCISAGHVGVDDAYFTFSFAKNLAIGNGPTYSHGLRVEGYSTPLWMLLLALPMLFTRGQAPLLCARIMGAPFVLLLGYAVYRLARACGTRRHTATFCVLLLSFNTDLAVAYLSGMETLPHVALTAFAFASLVASFSKVTWQRTAAWAGLAVALMRIDGFLTFAFLIVGALVRAVNLKEPRPFRLTARLHLAPVGVFALWFAARYAYYGLPLPSTYYAKQLIGVLLPLRGIEYVANEVTGQWLWLGLAAWCWLLWRRNLAAAILGAFSVLHLVYVTKVGGDWMPFGRFVLPVVPLLLVLSVVGSRDILDVCSTVRRWLNPLIVPVAAGCLAMLAVRMDHRFWNSPHEEAKNEGVKEQSRNVDSYRYAAKFLRQVIPPGGRLVTDYGGVFACYTQGALIEMWGLANATIATRGDAEGINPIYGKTCAACYPDLRPEYFHVMAPLVRPVNAFSSADEVIANVWQTNTIGRYIDFRQAFSVGRVVSPKGSEALYFLQRRGPSFSTETRKTKAGYVIDFPFGP